MLLHARNESSQALKQFSAEIIAIIDKRDPQLVNYSVTQFLYNNLNMSRDSDMDRDSLPWPARLSHLASTPMYFPEDSASAQTIHRCLDTITSVLQHDPRAGFGQEIAKCRPPRRHSLSLASGVTAVEPEPASESPLLHVPDDDDAPRADREMQSQLTALLREVTALNGELDSRRREAGEIYESLEGRCRELTRTIAELEGEVVEL